jgi:hypothetical protein
VTLTAETWLDYADPVRIFRRNGLFADQWQRDLLRDNPYRALICVGRQGGKSLLLGAKALHTALFCAKLRNDPAVRPAPYVLIASFKHEKAKELLAKAMSLYRPYRDQFPIVAETSERVQFANGGIIQTIPATSDNARGPAADLVILEEAAFTDRELYSAIMYTLSTTNGPLYAISTPPPKPAGWWWEAWTQNGKYGGEDGLKARDTWHRVFMRSTECPRITKEFLETALREDGEERFNRECLCEFPKASASQRGLLLPDLSSFLVDDAGDVYPGAAV